MTSASHVTPQAHGVVKYVNTIRHYRNVASNSYHSLTRIHLPSFPIPIPISIPLLDTQLPWTTPVSPPPQSTLNPQLSHHPPHSSQGNPRHYPLPCPGHPRTARNYPQPLLPPQRLLHAPLLPRPVLSPGLHIPRARRQLPVGHPGIYRWYRTLSPRVEIAIDSAGTFLHPAPTFSRSS